MQKIHLVSGVALLIIFALTGQYMKNSLALPEGDFNAQRMMYRASHIYLLFAGCVNTLVGCYWSKLESVAAGYIQSLASLLIVVSQVFLLLAFYYEPPVVDQDRILTVLGCVSLLAGVVLTLVARFMAGVLGKRVLK
jgi:hypothetical protein